jgi:hypothetical protein
VFSLCELLGVRRVAACAAGGAFAFLLREHGAYRPTKGLTAAQAASKAAAEEKKKLGLCELAIDVQDDTVDGDKRRVHKVLLPHTPACIKGIVPDKPAQPAKRAAAKGAGGGSSSKKARLAAPSTEVWTLATMGKAICAKVPEDAWKPDGLKSFLAVAVAADSETTLAGLVQLVDEHTTAGPTWSGLARAMCLLALAELAAQHTS